MARSAALFHLIRRPWTRAERRVVWHGFFGRLAIAVEPLLCAVVFAVLTAALFVQHREEALVLSPIFGLATLAFVVYAIILMVAPTRALLQTFSPIYVVDGYVRYRKVHLLQAGEPAGFVAVLDEERSMLREWPLAWDARVFEGTQPAMVEYSDYGGIHRIDGRSTGVLPESVRALTVGGGPPEV